MVKVDVQADEHKPSEGSLRKVRTLQIKQHQGGDFIHSRTPLQSHGTLVLSEYVQCMTLFPTFQAKLIKMERST